MKRVLSVLLVSCFVFSLFFVGFTGGKVSAAVLEVDKTLTQVLISASNTTLLEAVITY